jgi:hypothetical protein
MHKCLRLAVLTVLLSGPAAEADFPSCYPSDCPPTYFLVAAMEPYHSDDSYALLISDPCNIAHAYDLAEYGPSVGETIVGAYVERWDPNDGINLNRNYLDPNAPSWSWYVTEFDGFADLAIELCDGWPTGIEYFLKEYPYVDKIQICFWAYTVVAALGTELDPWFYVLKDDCTADFYDFAIIASTWPESGCEYPGWCGGADLNVSGKVDFIDLALLAERWLWHNPAGS